MCSSSPSPSLPLHHRCDTPSPHPYPPPYPPSPAPRALLPSHSALLSAVVVSLACLLSSTAPCLPVSLSCSLPASPCISHFLFSCHSSLCACRSLLLPFRLHSLLMSPSFPGSTHASLTASLPSLLPACLTFPASPSPSSYTLHMSLCFPPCLSSSLPPVCFSARHAPCICHCPHAAEISHAVISSRPALATSLPQDVALAAHCPRRHSRPHRR